MLIPIQASLPPNQNVKREVSLDPLWTNDEPLI